jgi:hypothetical protein
MSSFSAKCFSTLALRSSSDWRSISLNDSVHKTARLIEYPRRDVMVGSESNASFVNIASCLSA